MNAVARITVRLTVVALMLWTAVLVGAEQKQQPNEGSSAVAQALDRPLKTLTIRDEAIPAALDRIGKQVGIHITIDPQADDLLPWGENTRLKAVTIEGASLRQVLPKVLGALGMTYKIEDNGLRVVATEPLKRMNRRATWDDLKLLRRCNELEYTPENFATFKLQYRITSKVDAPKMFQTQLAKAGRGTVAEMLEVATSALGWVWFPNGDHLVIRTCEAQIANLMARRITTRFVCEPLSHILADLATRAETPIHFEPGMMLKLPPSTAQSFSLLLRRTSIRQAFELIAAETGVKYDIRRDGIYVGLSPRIGSKGGAGIASRRSPYVGKISIPSADGTYTYDFLLREDELPDDVLAHRRQIIEEYIQKMRKDMAPDQTIRSPK